MTRARCLRALASGRRNRGKDNQGETEERSHQISSFTVQRQRKGSMVQKAELWRSQGCIQAGGLKRELRQTTHSYVQRFISKTNKWEATEEPIRRAKGKCRSTCTRKATGRIWSRAANLSPEGRTGWGGGVHKDNEKRKNYIFHKEPIGGEKAEMNHSLFTGKGSPLEIFTQGARRNVERKEMASSKRKDPSRGESPRDREFVLSFLRGNNGELT